jgi:hypothetical protein
MTLYRIDDISLNTDKARLMMMMRELVQLDRNAHFMLAVSPIVFAMDEASVLQNERPFPSILNAYSDSGVFFRGSRSGIPPWLPEVVNSFERVTIASHGLVHVDHRLLNPSVQTFSIEVSCAIVGSKIFVPPFNKWTTHMTDAAEKLGVELVIWEDGWRHLKFQTLSLGDSNRYYFHTHDFTDEQFALALGGAIES